MKHSVSNHYTIELNIQQNPYNLDTDDLFTLATRNNTKRRFLFVSKILGKHLPVKPYKILNYNKLLAMMCYEHMSKKQSIDHNILLKSIHEDSCDQSNLLRQTKYFLDEKTVFIGFAETATGMTHGIFNAFTNSMGMYHTTRESIQYTNQTISFQEPHSHATDHIVYPHQSICLSDAQRIILIDDEISSGQTLLNIIKNIKEQFGVKKYTVLTYLDWRNTESLLKYEDFEKFNHVDIEVLSLIKGKIGQIENGFIDDNKIKAHSLFSNEALQSEIVGDTPAKSVYIDSFSKDDIQAYSSEGTVRNYNRFTGRFGLTHVEHQNMINIAMNTAQRLQPYVNGKTLVLGTEEFMFIPLMIADLLDGDIYYKSTTRSPIYPCTDENYCIKSGLQFKSTYSENINNYLYNISQENYDTILILHEFISGTQSPAIKALNHKLSLYCDRVYDIHIGQNWENKLSDPPHIGTYSDSDVVFLLKEISDQVKEQDNHTREKAIQSGVHYSEMLPIEYHPSEEYMRIYQTSLKAYSTKLAKAIGITAGKIIKTRGPKTVLVSLARAGTPTGVLIKKYIERRYGYKLPHYSISIIRGKGIDENALHFIRQKHPEYEIQFIDGWTGKGAITSELKEALDNYQIKYGKVSELNYELAVIADPGHCVEIYGTREDFLIPNACLNSTISGLLSRTIHRKDLIGTGDFHGVKYYRDLEDSDVSKEYIDCVTSKFDQVFEHVDLDIKAFSIHAEKPKWIGMQDVKEIQDEFDIESIHFIKPGIGETTRVLLRRIPWKILINPDAPNLEHVLKLAEEKKIPVEHYPLKAYACCGIVKALKGE